MEKQQITIGIHSRPIARQLTETLRNHDIDCICEDATFAQAQTGEIDLCLISVDVSDLVAAVTIVESGFLTKATLSMNNDLLGWTQTILIPVDLSESSVLACKIGFALARRLDCRAMLLHVYAPYYPAIDQIAAVDPASDMAGIYHDDIEAAGEEFSIVRSAESRMAKFTRDIRQMQKNGEIVDVKFSSKLESGVPEDVIREYARNEKPMLVVMATRGAHKRREELIGSVTAEVIDTCRVPVFTVPENIRFESVESIKRLAYFCNLDMNDATTIRSLMIMFDNPSIEISLIPAVERVNGSMRGKIMALRQALEEQYPLSHFRSHIFDSNNFRQELEDFLEQDNTQLIIVPNKKQSILRRLFKPGIAHRILFEKDIPMLAFPI